MNFTTKDNIIPDETITIYKLQTYFGTEPMSFEKKIPSRAKRSYTTHIQSETEF